MNLHKVGSCTIEVKSKVNKWLERGYSIFIINFVAILFLYALFGG
ncbi:MULTISPECIES: hypothetical protein [unclassified Methylophaga]|jgi:hypothetical protein|nr:MULTISPECIES: hypothetical protein [unclassified Methylophaga]